MTGMELAAWIGVGLMALAILATVGVAAWQKRRKILTFAAFTHFPIVSAGPLTKSIDIVFDGHAVEDPHLLVIPFRNSGNTAIRPEDWERPIHVRFDDADILDFEAKSEAPGLHVDVTIADVSGFDVTPMLLNRGEGFVITALLDGCPHGLYVSARIADCVVRDEETHTSPSLALVRSLEATPLSFTVLGIDVLGLVTTLRRRRAQGRAPTHRHR